MDAPPGLIALADAARDYGFRYNTLRDMAREGVFTVVILRQTAERPRKFLNRSELDLWRAGGVAAVTEARRKQPKSKRGK